MKEEEKGKILKKELVEELKLSSTVSYNIDTILVRDPVKFLSDSIRDKRFLVGVIVSVMYFERLGVKKLKEYFTSKKIPLKPMKIENLRLKTIMKMLEGFELISHDLHSLMGEVVTERNYIVHKLKHPDAINKNKAEKIIKKSIECVKDLEKS